MIFKVVRANHKELVISLMQKMIFIFEEQYNCQLFLSLN